MAEIRGSSPLGSIPKRCLFTGETQLGERDGNLIWPSFDTNEASEGPPSQGSEGGVVVRNPVELGKEQDRAARQTQQDVGPVARISRKYDASSSEVPGRSCRGSSCLSTTTNSR